MKTRIIKSLLVFITLGAGTITAMERGKRPHSAPNEGPAKKARLDKQGLAQTLAGFQQKMLGMFDEKIEPKFAKINQGLDGLNARLGNAEQRQEQLKTLVGQQAAAQPEVAAFGLYQAIIGKLGQKLEDNEKRLLRPYINTLPLQLKAKMHQALSSGLLEISFLDKLKNNLGRYETFMNRNNQLQQATSTQVAQPVPARAVPVQRLVAMQSETSASQEEVIAAQAQMLDQAAAAKQQNQSLAQQLLEKQPAPIVDGQVIVDAEPATGICDEERSDAQEREQEDAAQVQQPVEKQPAPAVERNNNNAVAKRAHSQNNAQLIEAAKKGDLNQIRALREQEVDITTCDENGLSALHWAAMYNHQRVVQFLINNGVDKNGKDKTQTTPLHYAAWHGCHDSAQRLIVNEALVNAKETAFGNTPLHSAIYGVHEKSQRLEDTEQYVNLIEFLLKQGADIRAHNKEKLTPKAYANKLDLGKIVRIIETYEGRAERANSKQEADISESNEEYQLPGQDTSKQGQYAHLSKKEKNKQLFDVIEKGSLQEVKALLDNGADLGSQITNQRRPLHAAVQQNQNAIAKELVGRGANVNICAGGYGTPLHIAVRNNNFELVKYLVDHGAQVNAQTSEANKAKTPLHVAAFGGNLKIVECLKRNGARTDVRDAKGNTPLDLVRNTKDKDKKAVARYLEALDSEPSDADANLSSSESEQENQSDESDEEVHEIDGFTLRCSRGPKTGSHGRTSVAETEDDLVEFYERPEDMPKESATEKNTRQQ